MADCFSNRKGFGTDFVFLTRDGYIICERNTKRFFKIEFLDLKWKIINNIRLTPQHCNLVDAIALNFDHNSQYARNCRRFLI